MATNSKLLRGVVPPVCTPFTTDYEVDEKFRNNTLTDFGIIRERKISKINRKGSILKLREEEDIKSIYPMVDEFGYGVKDFFVFASTWDYKYHVETIVLVVKPGIQITSPTIVPKTIGQPSLIQTQKFR